MRNSKFLKNPILLAGGAFALTLLAVIAWFGLRLSAADATQPAIEVTAEPTGLQLAAAEALGVAEPPPVTISREELEALTRPSIDTILPANLGVIGPEDLVPLAAWPVQDLVPASVNPDEDPVLALEANTNTVIEPIAARWTVVGQEPGWVRVIVPVGRGALPSENPAAVNHQAVWVPEDLVVVEEEQTRIEISISERRLTVFEGDDVVGSIPVGVGVEGVTDTPLGLCSVIGTAFIQTGALALLTSCQSEQLDEYAGSAWATIAIHEGAGFSLTNGGAVSNGCVRVSPAHFEQYLTGIRIGTPVIVVA